MWLPWNVRGAAVLAKTQPSATGGEGRSWTALGRTVLLLALGLVAGPMGCGGRHVAAGDGDADAGGDADVDADLDEEPDTDEGPDSWPDADEPADADLDEEPDADEGSVETTWLLELGRDVTGSGRVNHLLALPGGDFMVAGSYGSEPWLGRFDASGREIWSWRYHFEARLGGIEGLALGPEGEVLLGGSNWLGAVDGDGRLLWFRNLITPSYTIQLDALTHVSPFS